MGRAACRGWWGASRIQTGTHISKMYCHLRKLLCIARRSAGPLGLVPSVPTPTAAEEGKCQVPRAGGATGPWEGHGDTYHTDQGSETPEAGRI